MQRCYEVKLPESLRAELADLGDEGPCSESFELKESMHYSRVDHSMCFIDERYLLVTGSYIRDEKMNETCERYDIQMDRFAKFPPLNVGRCSHSSCSFDARYVLVFCGLIIVRTEYEEVSEEDRMVIIKERVNWTPTNSIERLDTQNKARGWTTLDIPLSPLTPRRTPGVVQVSSSEILIFGGQARGKQLKASFRLDTRTCTITKGLKSIGAELNPRYRPVVLTTQDCILASEIGTSIIYERKKHKTAFQPTFDLQRSKEL